MTLDELKEELNKKESWWLSVKYFPYRVWYQSGELYRRIKWGFQRMFRGYDDTAYWGLDGYLTDIALPVLKWLRAHGHGLPWNQESTEATSHTQESWNALLDKMILAFQIMHDNDYSDPTSLGAPDISVDKDAYWKWHEERRAKVDEGLKWFAKYFQSLWD